MIPLRLRWNICSTLSHEIKPWIVVSYTSLLPNISSLLGNNWSKKETLNLDTEKFHRETSLNHSSLSNRLASQQQRLIAKWTKNNAKYKLPWHLEKFFEKFITRVWDLEFYNKTKIKLIQILIKFKYPVFRRNRQERTRIVVHWSRSCWWWRHLAPFGTSSGCSGSSSGLCRGRCTRTTERRETPGIKKLFLGLGGSQVFAKYLAQVFGPIVWPDSLAR